MGAGRHGIEPACKGHQAGQGMRPIMARGLAGRVMAGRRAGRESWPAGGPCIMAGSHGRPRQGGQSGGTRLGEADQERKG